ncbi:MAG: conjugal transfer protein TraL [Deltaproteobacteria bacterium]|nr:conjugal transfer protein TraL [Deltaproteobacteria bacterium]
MNLHLTLQGKGGVGKTLVAVLLAQYFTEKEEFPPFCIDIDPVNRSFAGFKKLSVITQNIIKNKEIEARKFDELMDKIITTKENNCIVDAGASTFIPLTAYLQENSMLEFLTSQNIKIFVHVVITGGQALDDTIRGLSFIIEEFGNTANVVVWLNEYFGEIENNGKSFEESKIFLNNKENIYGLITIPEMTKSTFGIDIKQMLTDRVTFDEYINSDRYFIIPRQRIKIFKETMFNNISMVF